MAFLLPLNYRAGFGQNKNTIRLLADGDFFLAGPKGLTLPGNLEGSCFAIKG